jgi:hypothetical protein
MITDTDLSPALLYAAALNSHNYPESSKFSAFVVAELVCSNVIMLSSSIRSPVVGNGYMKGGLMHYTEATERKPMDQPR